MEREKKLSKKKQASENTSAESVEGNGSSTDEMRLDIIDEGLRKRYLSRLSEMDTAPVQGLPEADQDLSCNVCMYHITQITYSEAQNVIGRLTTVFNTISAYTGNVFTVIDSDGEKAELYIGVRNNDLKEDRMCDAAVIGDTFRRALRGNLPGIRMETCSREKIREVSDRILSSSCISAASVKGSLRSADKSCDCTQGLENLMSAMHGKKYTGIIIAEAGSADNIEGLRKNFQEIYSKLSLCRNTHYSDNPAAGGSGSKSFSEMSTNEKAKTLGNFLLSIAGIGIGIAKIGAMGAMIGTMITGQLTSFLNTLAPSDKSSKVNIKSTDSMYENRKVSDLMEILSDGIKRAEEYEKYGMWNVAGYFTSDDPAAAEMAAVNYRALMSGDGCVHEISAINKWNAADDKEKMDEIRTCLSRFIHPTFIYCISETDEDADHSAIYTNASVAVSGKELSLNLGFPMTSAE